MSCDERDAEPAAPEAIAQSPAAPPVTPRDESGLKIAFARWNVARRRLDDARDQLVVAEQELDAAERAWLVEITIGYD